MAKITVGYWALRALVEPIHLYLEYKGIPYEKKSYTFDNSAEWFETDKANLGIDFPNIPYIIDGDVKLAQSCTILKYLEKKYGDFCNGDPAHDAKLDLMLETIQDLRMPFLLMCVGPGEFAEKRERYATDRLLKKWEYFDGWLSTRKFMTGDSLCVADFSLWNIIDYNNLFNPEFLGKFTNVQRFKKDVESDPKMEAYLKNPDYKQFPITPPFASWGYKAPEN